MESLIRRGKVDDAPAIVKILNHYIANTTVSFEMEPVSEEEMTIRITVIAARYPFFVYTEDGEVMGYCYVHQWKERKAYNHTAETTIYLHPSVKRSGIGTQLMRRLIKECRDYGLKSLIACVTQENVESMRFHEKIGFEKVSHFKSVGRKFDRWLDVIDYEMLLQ